MNCSAAYHDEIDVNYLTLIRMMASNITQFVTSTAGMNTSALTAFISSKAHYIDLLYESERLLREYLVWLSILYLDNYADFADNLLSSKTSLITAMMVISALTCCYWAYVVMLIRREKQLLERIVRMYRPEDK